MKDDNCIFCKIASGEIPSVTFYEDEDFRAILDIGPASKGHALILPKNHYANIYELPEDMTAKAFVLAKQISAQLTDVLDCHGFNILQNNGEPAGQSVFHFHIHLLPRYQNDNVDLTWKPGQLTDQDKNFILEQLKR